MARRREAHELLMLDHPGPRARPARGYTAPWQVTLRADFPELDRLKTAERRAWILALHVKHPFRRFAVEVLWTIGLIAAYLILCIAGLAVLYAAWLVVHPVLGSPLDFPGNLILASIIGVWIVISHRAADLFTDLPEQRRWRRLLREQLRSRAPACAACRYPLSGVAPLPDRPAITRCPECGLINPVMKPRSDAQP